MGVISLQFCKLNKTHSQQCQAEMRRFMLNFCKDFGRWGYYSYCK